MMVEVKEFIEVVTTILHKECTKRDLEFDEDVLQEVLMWGWDALTRLYDSRRGVKWTTYIWRVVDSVLKDRIWRMNRGMSIVSVEEMKGDSDGEWYLEDKKEDSDGEWYLEDKKEERFSSRVLGLLENYWGAVGQDFLRLVVGDVDISNALRSVAVSNKKGEEWVEWWLGRSLTEQERRCCRELRELLAEV
jgi:hypothetical protein